MAKRKTCTWAFFYYGYHWGMWLIDNVITGCWCAVGLSNCDLFSHYISCIYGTSLVLGATEINFIDAHNIYLEPEAPGGPMAWTAILCLHLLFHVPVKKSGFTLSLTYFWQEQICTDVRSVDTPTLSEVTSASQVYNHPHIHAVSYRQQLTGSNMNRLPV